MGIRELTRTCFEHNSVDTITKERKDAKEAEALSSA